MGARDVMKNRVSGLGRRRGGKDLVCVCMVVYRDVTFHRHETDPLCPHYILFHSRLTSSNKKNISTNSNDGYDRLL